MTRGADAIVVAAGSSVRMGGGDKLGREIGGRPLLAWSIDAMAAVDAVERIVVVTAAERREAIVRAPWLGPHVVRVVAGAGRRHESVAAGLAALDALDAPSAADARSAPDERIVLVHDGARPLASPALVRAVLTAAQDHGAAIPVLPVAETVKRVADGRIVETIDRTALATAQTPQGVRRGLLREAYGRFPPDGGPTWTDEAALLEACRIPVHAIPGEPGNLKVTIPADLDRVEAALATGSRPSDGTTASAGGIRVGIGSDSHPFGPGEPLMLGGISVPGGFRLAGHSDGDVALHAIADALLGAAGLGDLGRIFPAGQTTPRGIASRELLVEVVRRVVASQFRPATIDLTIVAGRPRLGGHLDAMRNAIAEIVGVEAAAVNVKASSGNLDGMEGAGRGISAQAVATLVPVP